MSRTGTDAGDERLFRGYSGRILLLITGGEFVVSLGGLVLPPLLPSIIVDLGITPSQAGAVMTVFWLSIALNNFPGGRLADGLTQKTVIVAGLGISIIGLALLAAAPTYALLLLGVAVIGIGRGLYQPAAIVQISTVFSRRRGQALGIRNAAFNVGGTAAGGVAVVVLALAGWRAAFPPIALATAGILLLMHRWNRQPYVLHRIDLDWRSTGFRLVAAPEIRWILVALSLYGFAWNGATSFLPAYLQLEKGLSPATASIAFSALFLFGALVQPSAGALGDRLGYVSAATAAAVVCSIGLTVLLAVDGTIGVAVGLVLFAVGLAAFWPVMTAHGMSVLPDESRGADWGAVTAVFLIVESVGSTFVGVVVETVSYDAAYLALLGCFVTTAVITRGVVRSNRRRHLGSRYRRRG